MKRKIYFLTLCRLIIISLLFTVTAGAYGQTFEVSGTVTDKAGLPLPGVNIVIQGTSNGTITDLDGAYSLPLQDKNATLNFSFIGYQTKNVNVNGQLKINVVLEEEVKDLSEVIVIGYGTIKKKDLTGSVATVSSEDLTKMPVASMSQALQGRSSGVLVNQGGNPSEDAIIRVRGIGSITARPDPLIILDGVPTSMGLNTINPDDIESLQILKDASASAIYGARGANGVILINTKRGKKGKVLTSYTAYAGVSFLPKKFDLLKSDEYATLMDTLYRRSKLTNLPTAYSKEERAKYGNVNTDWQDELFRVGQIQNHAVSVSGGSENSRFSISGNYYTQEGILITTGMSRMTLRANSDFVISKRLKVGESISIGRNNSRDEASKNGSPWMMSVLASPLMPIYCDTALGGYAGPSRQQTGSNDKTNSVAELKLNEKNNQSDNIFANVYAEFEFMPGLTYKLNTGYEATTWNGSEWNPEYEIGNIGARSNRLDQLSMSNSRNTQRLIENQLTYKKTMGKHDFQVALIHAAQDRNNIYFSATDSSFSNPNLNVFDQGYPKNVSGNESRSALLSYAARLIYNYGDKYYLTASVRRDGSSRFGKEYRFGIFPSFSLAWTLSNEEFFKKLPALSNYINTLKIRGGWGKTGNENIGEFKYDTYISPGQGTSRYSLGVVGKSRIAGVPFYNIGNPGVHWEAAEMTNLALDLSMFNNKVNFSADFYVKNQNDLLVQQSVSWLTGFFVDDARPWVNLGKLQNKGLDLSLSYKNMEGAFNYSTGINFSYVANKVIQLSQKGEKIYSGNNITFEDHPISSFYMMMADGIFQSKEEVAASARQQNGTSAGDIRFKDLNKDGKIDASNDRTVVGKPLPDFYYGINFDCWYKGFDMSLLFNGMQNFQVLNSQRRTIALPTDVNGLDENKLREALNYWTPENHSTTVTRPVKVDDNKNGDVSTWWLEEGSFLRLSSAQLGYSIPASLLNKLSISKIRLYVSSNNLFLLTKYKGWDPELKNDNPIEMGTDGGTYPKYRSVLFGVQLEF